MGVCCSCSLDGVTECEMHIAEWGQEGKSVVSGGEFTMKNAPMGEPPDARPGRNVATRKQPSRAESADEDEPRVPAPSRADEITPLPLAQPLRAGGGAPEEHWELVAPRSASTGATERGMQQAVSNSTSGATTSVEGEATAQEDPSPSGTTVSPTSGRTVSPTDGVLAEDDWADWTATPAPKDFHAQHKEVASKQLPAGTRIALTGNLPEVSGAISALKEGESATIWLAPATRELSAAAPDRPTVWPRFASIEAWIATLPSQEQTAGMVSKPLAMSSSAKPPCTWHLRPSIGTWLAVRISRRAPASGLGQAPISCTLSFGGSLPETHPGAGTPEVKFSDVLGLFGPSTPRAGGVLHVQVEKPKELQCSPHTLPAVIPPLVTPPTREVGEPTELPFGVRAPLAAVEPLAAQPAREVEDVFAGCRAELAVKTFAPCDRLPTSRPPAERRSSVRSWHLRPSVGTWLVRRARDAVEAKAPVVPRHPEPEQASMGLKTASHGATSGPAPCQHVLAKALASLEVPGAEVFRAAAAVKPKMVVPLKPSLDKAPAGKESVLSFDPYAPSPDDEEPSTTDTEGPRGGEECPIA
mmetsp:Transcript_76341/g.210746  ORF Transcript_76341/g.210746 Transcript_76341/m.210746 type:complete len:584 (-) Transcript_76341:209-1960(-)